MHRKNNGHFNKEMVERIRKGDHVIWNKALLHYAEKMYREEVNYEHQKLQLEAQLIYLN